MSANEVHDLRKDTRSCDRVRRMRQKRTWNTATSARTRSPDNLLQTRPLNELVDIDSVQQTIHVHLIEQLVHVDACHKPIDVNLGQNSVDVDPLDQIVHVDASYNVIDINAVDDGVDDASDGSGEHVVGRSEGGGATCNDESIFSRRDLSKELSYRDSKDVTPASRLVLGARCSLLDA